MSDRATFSARRHRAQRTAAAGMAAAMGMLSILLGAPPAHAHTELRSSQPAAGATLDKLPATVRLVFNQPISREFSRVSLTRTNDNVTRRLDLVVAGPRGTARVSPMPRLEQPPSDPRPRQERWRVDYRVVSADDHPIGGSFTFTTRPPAPVDAPTANDAASATPTPLAQSATPSAQGQPVTEVTADDDSGSSMLAVLVIGAVTATAGLGVVAWLTRARARSHTDQG